MFSTLSSVIYKLRRNEMYQREREREREMRCALFSLLLQSKERVSVSKLLTATLLLYLSHTFFHDSLPWCNVQ